MIIDAHHHLWSLAEGLRWAPGSGYSWLDDPSLSPIRRDITVAELRGHLAAGGVDRTVLVEGGVCRHEETAAFLELASRTPEIAGVVGFLDLRAGPPVTELGTSPLLVGIRDQVQAYEVDFLREPAVVERLREVAAAGLVIDLVIRPEQLSAAAYAAGAVPEGRFVLDHLGKPPIRAGDLAGWRADLAALARHPNVYAKFSGLATEADWHTWTVSQLRPCAEAALEVFGPQRLLWGSDWPVVDLAGGYQRWLATARELVPAADHAAVFGGTAAAVYRLEGE